ncbi:hypothetical protein SS1G_12418 [Sclerotinia sclerotiorum 1980 UF-70]|uniref:Nephrocystin 3-like N-terminal domain-containing protein n=1 Tax=Sclerotinia sclerotiorum (strain ATCC 18683 / 1980 / Ss-1) TaxID=665079 RepID=A7F495_SCLS1|nr:hypothetical protein SS1G_12418 [Sclerotinia sclerotiorum 1980 UF-70]EDN97566.1 hypothetical protein SS1G_12418 [Sclerotinia sclerotiorum 1980 UF-70]
MASTAKTTKNKEVSEAKETTKINPRPKKLKCFRIQGIPIGKTKESLEKELRDSLPMYKSDCYLTLANSSSSKSMATLNSFENPGKFLPTYYTVDDNFLGITPLFEGDNASVEPIIFVAHSLGGLLVKEALYIALMGSENPENRDFFKSSYGLMFFGVPNLGLNNKSLMQIVAGGLNEQMIKDLQVNDEDHEPTQFLSTIKQKFKQCCREGQFQIRSYYELRETQMVRKLDNGLLVKDGPLCYMVSKNSACQIGFNDNFCYEEGLLRDHSDLVKFSNQYDDDYKRVLDSLKGLVDKAPNIAEARFASIKNEKCHWDDLNDPPYTSFKESNKVQTAVKGTLQWLIDDQTLPDENCTDGLQAKDFIKWRDSEKSNFLLVIGTPGQGKSVLSNFVVDHLKDRIDQQSSNSKIIYYFCNIKNEERFRTASAIFRSLIVQLCEDQRLYQRLPQNLKDTSKKFATESFAKLGNIFHDMITKNPYDRVYCIIDGLDVYSTDIEDLLQYLDKHFALEERNINRKPLFQLFCTSRPEWVTSIKFSHKKILRASTDDLTLFINFELSLFEEEDGFRDDMKKIITKAAQAEEKRTFLWISIVLRELRKIPSPSIDEIENKIKQIPLELDALYKNLVQKLLTTPKYGVILAWITYAVRPLHFRELEDALAVSMTKGARSLKDCEKKRIVLNSKVIQTNLGSLIDVIGPNPFLIHQTLRDFLKRSGILEKAEILDQFKRPGILLANTCISYLHFEDIVESRTGDEDDFLSYAANYWYEHIDTLEEAQDNIEQLESVLNAKGQALWEWLAKVVTSTIPNRLTEELGDSYIVPAAKSSINVFRELLNWPYSERVLITEEVVKAAAGNLWSGKEVMMLLLDKRGADVVITEEVVKAAAENWESGTKVMMLLLEKRGADMVITEKMVKIIAGQCEKEVMMLLLEKRGADVIITEEVVKAAAWNEESGKEVMMLLLEKRGADMVITEEIVEIIAGQCEKEVMMLLLEKRGADMVITEEIVEIIAGRYEKEVMIFLLDKRGADVVITEEVVKAAAGNFWSGKEVMMLLLEKRGADVVITEEVMKAAAGNLESGKEVMMLLLEKRGADMVITEEIVEIIAGRYEKEVMIFLLDKRGVDVVITEEMVKAAVGNKYSGEKVMIFLLDKRGVDVVITEEVVKAAAGNKYSGEKVMMLLLEKRGADVVITEEVVKAAAGNKYSGEKVMMLLLEKRGADVVITEEVVKAAAGNKYSGEKVMMLLLDK